MLKKLKPGDKLYHTAMIDPVFVKYDDAEIEVRLSAKRIIPLPMESFGKSLFFSKEHYIKGPEFNNNDEYFRFCEEKEI